uniref:Uncharacterized protein n=1 Tax=Daphnia galeata TaxID=27404 RepID=A0A8J2RQR1_9CRUS|nr:unnamed protein product [Daphnia galeata]
MENTQHLIFPSIRSATTPLLHFNMYKSMSLLVLVALAACVVSMETQDQETAEQYFRIHGVYPSWYPYGATAFNGVRSYPYTGYPAATAYTGYPVAGFPTAAYPTAFAGVKNVVSPYAYSYGYNTYPYGANGGFAAVPYPAAAYPTAYAGVKKNGGIGAVPDVPAARTNGGFGVKKNGGIGAVPDVPAARTNGGFGVKKNGGIGAVPDVAAAYPTAPTTPDRF